MVEFRISIQNSVLVVAHGGPCLLLMLMPLASEACSTSKAKGLCFMYIDVSRIAALLQVWLRMMPFKI